MMQTRTMIALLLLLCACGGGGGGGGGSGIDPRLARLDIYEAQKLRVLGDVGAGVPAMTPTAVENLPTAGALVFDGAATIRIEHATRPLVLSGDASMTMDFDTASATGTLDAFFGTNGAGQIVDYAGAIGLEGLTIGPDPVLDYAGALQAPGETLVFAGTMQGLYLGNPVGAVTVFDLEAGVTRNGAPSDATVIVIGEIAVPP